MGTWDDYAPPTNSRWYSAGDLPPDGSIVPVVIARLSKEQVKDDERSCLLLQDGEREGVVLNQTRFEQLRDALPNVESPDHLVDKVVGLKRGRTQFGGKRVDCVEIVAVASPNPPAVTGESPKEEPFDVF